MIQIFFPIRSVDLVKESKYKIFSSGTGGLDVGYGEDRGQKLAQL